MFFHFFFGTQHVVILTDYTQRCWLALIWSACSFMPSEKIIVHVIWFRKKKKLRTHNEPSLFQRCRVPSPLHALICVHTSKQAGFTSEQFGHPDSRKKVAWNTFSPRGIASGLQVPVNVSSVDKADEVWHPLLVCRKNQAVHHDWNHKSSEMCTFCGCWMMVIPCHTMWYQAIKRHVMFCSSKKSADRGKCGERRAPGPMFHWDQPWNRWRTENF